ncbi:MAG: efflux RND transporter periplasmic adaptor subunit, partial [Rickettsiales bacterium]
MKSLSLLAIAAAATLTAFGVSAQQGPLPVSVANPIVREIVEWDEYTGRFEAVDRVAVVARVSGFLESIHFKEGDVVTKGQLLFVIDPRPFEAQRQAAGAALAGARTRLDLAEKELARAERLLKRNNISEELVDQRRAAKETARTDVLAALAALRITDLDVEFTKVKAPFRGRISDARVDVGNYVNGGSSQATLLTTVVSMDPILFTFSASEAEFLKYSRLHLEGRRESSRVSNNPVFVRLMDETEFTRQGRMYFVDNE